MIWENDDDVLFLTSIEDAACCCRRYEEVDCYGIHDW
jgi:hypothetical protein